MRTGTKHLVSLIVTGAFAVLAIGSGTKKEQSGAAPGEPTATQAGAAAKPATVAKIGDEVKFDDSTWVVLDAKLAGKTLKSNNQFQEDAKTEGKFVVVRFKVTNKTNKEERIMDQPKLVDSKGREFKHVDSQAFYVSPKAKTLGLEALPSSLAKEFSAVYEVAADSGGLQFQARALSAFGDKTLVDLAL